MNSLVQPRTQALHPRPYIGRMEQVASGSLLLNFVMNNKIITMREVSIND